MQREDRTVQDTRSGQGGPDRVSYYAPKIEGKGRASRDRSIEGYNHRLEQRAFDRQYLVGPTGKILRAPSRYLQRALKEKDEEAQDASRALGHAKAAGILLGEQADRMRMDEVLRDTASADRYVQAGSIFTEDSLTGAGSISRDVEGYSIIDPEEVTRGDLKMFRYRVDHPDAGFEELLKLRQETNARCPDGGRIRYRELGRRNGLRRQVDRLVDISEIRAFLELGRRLEKEDPGLFTPAQRQILHREGSILAAQSPGDHAAHMTLIRQILKSAPSSGTFSRLDPEGRMTEKDIARLLKGRIRGLRIEGPGENLVRGGLKALLWEQRCYRVMMEQRRRIHRRGSLKGWAMEELGSGMMEDEGFADMAGPMDHATSLAAVSTRAAVHTARMAGRAAGRTAGESVRAAGEAAALGFHAVGDDVAAQAARSLSESIIRAGQATEQKVREATGLPGRAAREMVRLSAGAGRLGWRIHDAGERLASTAVGRAVMRSRAYQSARMAVYQIMGGARRMGRITGRMAHRGLSAPFRLFSRAAEAAEQWVVRPAMLAVGLVFFLQLSIAAIFGGLGGSSSVTVAVLDTPEHFDNPGYTCPEEMGFQQRYEQSQAEFQAQIDGIVDGYAQTLDKRGRRIRYGVNSVGDPEGDGEHTNGVTLHFDTEKRDNLEDILSCMAVVMQQQQADHHKEALELVDSFYKSSHTYDHRESPLYDCAHGCETTTYHCNEAQDGYPSTDMRFAPYLHEELYVPDRDHTCEVDREDEGMAFVDYAGCTVTGTCYHNAGDEDDNFGRRRPARSVCSAPEAYWDCGHSCSRDDCTHDCSGSTLGCAGYWYCGGHDHLGCPDGHEAKVCFGHVDLVMDVHIKSMEELFQLGGVEDDDSGTGAGER